jgi:WD40 repeat protein
LEHESSYRALALSPDGSRVAADAWVWSTTEKGVQKKVLERAGGTALAPSPNSKYIAYSISKMIEIYVVDSGQRVARCHPSSPINPTGTVLSFSPDGSMLAVGDAKGKVRWWQLPEEVSR